MKDERQEELLDCIKDAINSICEDITQTRASEDNKDRAEAIKALAEAYKSIKRGVLK